MTMKLLLLFKKRRRCCCCCCLGKPHDDDVNDVNDVCWVLNNVGGMCLLLLCKVVSLKTLLETRTKKLWRA